MPRKVLNEKPLTIAEAKSSLAELGRELNQFQRRTLDYASSLARLDRDEAIQLVEKLMKLLDVSEKEAISIVNSVPESVEELRAFIPRHRVVDPAKLREASKVIAEYAK
ncbi:MAG: hypothetical protein ACE5PO_01085 [Candidatus Bathyarchaeia archaeon]